MNNEIIKKIVIRTLKEKNKFNINSINFINFFLNGHCGSLHNNYSIISFISDYKTIFNQQDILNKYLFINCNVVENFNKFLIKHNALDMFYSDLTKYIKYDINHYKNVICWDIFTESIDFTKLLPNNTKKSEKYANLIIKWYLFLESAKDNIYGFE